MAQLFWSVLGLAVVVGIPGLLILGFIEQLKTMHDLAIDTTGLTPDEAEWTRSWFQVDWSAAGLEPLSYRHGDEESTVVIHPDVREVELAPTGPRATIRLPEGVSGSHLTSDVLHRLEGLLPGADPMEVISRSRSEVVIGLRSRNPLDLDHPSPHLADVDPSLPSQEAFRRAMDGDVA
ncbi:hypothetical protein ACPXCG_03445 [Gordonia sp. DT218]|uniref:hypothetical protein n=1 Tax=Gordonia sp. DT218 TaxID=3416659 RepID=UPI003CED5CF7